MTLSENRVGDAGSTTEAELVPNGRAMAPAIRPLGPQHSAELSRLFLRLEATARVSRFGLATNDAYLAAYAAHALAEAAWVLGAFVDDSLRGLVEVYHDAPRGFAEAAFVVDRDWRRRGLGWALLCAACEVAAEGQAHILRMMFSRHNWPMRGLAMKAGSRFDLANNEIMADLALRRTPDACLMSPEDC
jgi:GNAT superfamily N-acetyltransferase